jgi:hypothetical protein
MRVLLLAALAALPLASCTDPKAASKETFAAAITRMLEGKAFCMSQFPRELGGVNSLGMRMGQMDIDNPGAVIRGGMLDISRRMTLAKAGVLTGTPNNAGGLDFAYGPNAFAVSGTPLDQTPSYDDGRFICFAKPKFDHVVKWEGPIRLGDYQSATVTYAFTLTDVAPWTSDPTVQRIEEVSKVIGPNASLERTAIVKLTSNGWEAQ